jgi:hypothetical protein
VFTSNDGARYVRHAFTSNTAYIYDIAGGIVMHKQQQQQHSASLGCCQLIAIAATHVVATGQGEATFIMAASTSILQADETLYHTVGLLRMTDSNQAMGMYQ